MPAGRPRSPRGAGRSAPVLSIRLDAETEAGLNIIAMEERLAGRREAAVVAIRYQALRAAGAERLARATTAVAAKRSRS